MNGKIQNIPVYCCLCAVAALLVLSAGPEARAALEVISISPAHGEMFANATNSRGYSSSVEAKFSQALLPESITMESFKILRSYTISAGAAHIVALEDGGAVAAWGSNGDGRCDVPEGLAGVAAVAAGGGHTVALKADGEVLAWGDNDNGQCDVPDGLKGVAAVAAGGRHTVVLKTDGSIVAWGDNSYGQCDAPDGLEGVIAVAAGENHTVALKADGSVIAWGSSLDGECDVPADLTGVTGIDAGAYYTLALRSNGTVVAWGSNEHGKCDAPADLTGVVDIAAGANCALALKADGTVVQWGGVPDPSPVSWWEAPQELSDPPADLAGVVAIAAGGGAFGGYKNAAVKSDGSVVVWGSCNQPSWALGLAPVLAAPEGLKVSTVTGSPSYSSRTHMAYFFPSEPFVAGASYFVTITTEVEGTVEVPDVPCPWCYFVPPPNVDPEDLVFVAQVQWRFHVSPRKDAVFDFGPEGLLVWSNNSFWDDLKRSDVKLVECADMNGDGKDDVIYEGGTGGDLWVTYGGDEMSSIFTEPHWISMDEAFFEPARERLDKEYWFRKSTSIPGVRVERVLLDRDCTARRLAHGDMDGNGKDELVIDLGNDGLWVIYNNSDCQRLSKRSTESIACGDLDGDGKDEVIAGIAGEGLFVRSNDGKVVKLGSISPRLIVCADLDGNGKDEIICDPGQAAPGLVVLYNGAPGWKRLAGISPKGIACGDVDGNGKDEIIVSLASGGLWIRVNDDSWEKLHSLSPDVVACTDLDGDGRDDIICGGGPVPGVWVNYGDGSWSPLNSMSPEGVVCGEINGE